MKDKNYDIKTGKWGPYNKDYLGISYIADEESGATFEFELFPGFYKRTVLANRVMQDNGVKMWGANSDLTYFAYRYEIEWKDKVYCDVTFHIQDDKDVLVECTFVNDTDIPQNVCLNACFSINYPTEKWWSFVTGYQPIYEANLPKNCLLIDAVDYKEANCDMQIALDGFFLGEKKVANATGKGTAIGGEYFYDKEHFLSYEVTPINASGIGVRYCAKEQATLTVTIGDERYLVELAPCEEFSYATLHFAEREISSFNINADGQATIDCLVLGTEVEKTFFTKKTYAVEAEIEKDIVCAYGAFGSKNESGEERLKNGEMNRFYVSYPNIEKSFSIAWDKTHRRTCRYYTDDIGILLNQHLHNEYHTIEEGRKTERVYDDIIFGPIALKPNGRETIRFILRSGSLQELKSTQPTINKRNDSGVLCNSDGEQYRISQNIMRSITLMNIMYPMYFRREYRKGYVPGRLWDCLYTWDNGFIGMGLATVDFHRAYECLNAYLTPVGDKHSPFIFSGTVFPTQILLYDYLFNHYEQYEELEKLYPMIKQYYSFFGDLRYRKGQMKSGLLKLWDINYNSGGWDDYPPQLALTHWEYDKPILDGASTENTTPVVTTAVTVLIAKILRKIALRLGKTEDVLRFDEDIELYSRSIQDYCWDEETGYYQYVVHDENGQPKTFFKYHDGTLFGGGLDGIYPYISGISNTHQDKKIVENIKNGLMTPFGISVVDTRQSYFSLHGYSNGCVWFPHEWILWNALLDKGERELATKIAMLSLQLSESEARETYNSLENISIMTGRGSGYHQFSGLSTPVLTWFKAYYTPNTISVGFLTCIFEKKYSDKGNLINFSYATESEKACALICVGGDGTYSFKVNGETVGAVQVTQGAYYVPLIGNSGKVIIDRS